MGWFINMLIPHLWGQDQGISVFREVIVVCSQEIERHQGLFIIKKAPRAAKAPRLTIPFFPQRPFTIFPHMCVCAQTQKTCRYIEEGTGMTYTIISITIHKYYKYIQEQNTHTLKVKRVWPSLLPIHDKTKAKYRSKHTSDVLMRVLFSNWTFNYTQNSQYIYQQNLYEENAL